MKKNLKKVISLYLVLIMIITSFAISPTVFASAKTRVAEDVLTKAINSYEETMSKISELGYSRNLVEAYKSYYKCLQYRDALNYGGADGSRAEQYANDLAYKASQMTVSKPLWPKQIDMGSLSGQSETSNYDDGMIFAEPGSIQTGNNDNKMAENTIENYHMFQTNEVYLKNFVWLYDGTTSLKAPVTFCFNLNRNIFYGYQDRGWFGVTMDDGNGLGFGSETWAYHSTNGKWSMTSENTKYDFSSDSKNLWGYNGRDLYGKNTWHFASNYMVFNGTAPDANQNYTAKLEPNISVYDQDKDLMGELSPTKATSGNRQHEDSKYHNRGFAYIINGKALTDGIANGLKKIDVTDTEYDSVISLLTAIETASTVSYMTINFSDTENAVNTMGADIKAKVDAINNANCTEKLVFADGCDYSNLRKTMTSSSEAYASENKNEDGTEKYTPETWQPFAAAYKNAKDAMLSLDPVGENDKYTKNAKQLNDELKRTFGELQLKKYYASFANLDASVKQAKDKLDELAQLGTTTLTATTVQNLVDTVSSLVYANYTEQQRDETLLSEQSKIDAEQQKVDEALNGLETGLDISALDASLESLDSLDRDEYDFSKLEGLKNSVATKDVSWNNKVIKCSAFKTQDDVDSAAAHIITEITSSKINYKIIAPEGITFNVSDIQAVPYGTEVVATAKDGKTAWYIGYKSVTASHDVKYQYSGETFTFVVMGDTTIKTEASSETITSRVQVQNNINNRVTSVVYVADNYKLPEPIVYPFYNFSHYEVNGEKHAIGDTVSVNSDTFVKAVYEPNAQETFTVTYASVMDSVENWEEISTKEYAYNSVVKYTSKVPVYWIGVYTSSEILNGNDYGYVLLGYGTEFIYHVNENIEIDATNKKAYDEQFVNELNPDGYTKNPYFVGNLDVDENGASANIRYANTNFNDTSQAVIKDQLASKGKISMLGRYYIPQEAEMIECGILFTKGEVSSLTLSDVDGKNVIRCKSFTQTAGNQFVISKVGCKAGETVSYCSYVKYEMNGKTFVKYSATDSEIL